MRCSHSSGMSNSDRSRWKLTEQTMIRFELTRYNIHSAVTRHQWHNDKNAWPPNTPGARAAEDDIQHQTPTPENNTQGLEEQMHSSNEATQRLLHQPQNTNSLRNTRDNTEHIFFEGEPAVILHAKNTEVGGSANENPRQDKVTMGRVHSPGSTNHQSLSLLVFSIMHHSWILAKSLLREAATAGLSAGLRTTVSNVESSA